MTIDDRISAAMKVLSELSRDAEGAGEHYLKYAANRAWHELFKARDTRTPSQLHRELTAHNAEER
jgi:hypothetical protein